MPVRFKFTNPKRRRRTIWRREKNLEENRRFKGGCWGGGFFPFGKERERERERETHTSLFHFYWDDLWIDAHSSFSSFVNLSNIDKTHAYSNVNVPVWSGCGDGGGGGRTWWQRQYIAACQCLGPTFVTVKKSGMDFRFASVEKAHTTHWPSSFVLLLSLDNGLRLVFGTLDHPVFFSVPSVRVWVVDFFSLFQCFFFVSNTSFSIVGLPLLNSPFARLVCACVCQCVPVFVFASTRKIVFSATAWMSDVLSSSRDAHNPNRFVLILFVNFYLGSSAVPIVVIEKGKKNSTTSVSSPNVIIYISQCVCVRYWSPKNFRNHPPLVTNHQFLLYGCECFRFCW